MRRMIFSLLPVILIAIVAAGSIGGCSSGEPCNFIFRELNNGTTQETQDSEWDCKNGGIEVFTIAFFTDDTGTRSDAGDFTYDQTKCRALDFTTDSLETGTLNNLDGFITTVAEDTFGQLTFDQTSDDLGDISVVCDYVLLVQ